MNRKIINQSAEKSQPTKFRVFQLFLLFSEMIATCEISEQKKPTTTNQKQIMRI